MVIMDRNDSGSLVELDMGNQSNGEVSDTLMVSGDDRHTTKGEPYDAILSNRYP